VDKFAAKLRRCEIGPEQITVVLVGEDQQFLQEIGEMLSAIGLFPTPVNAINSEDSPMKMDRVGAVIVDCPAGKDFWKQILLEVCQPVGIPLIVTSRIADERLWSEVLNFGGFDILVRPLDLRELERIMESALRWTREKSSTMRAAGI
jgi:FixJ family two-component response regulator